jgi:hypothetical protein
LAVLVMLAIPQPARADAPGPTEYSTEVTAIEPISGGFEMDVIGGDSFVRLAVERGTTIEVIGYQGEPYLRFQPDGAVEINRTAPSTYTSEDRFGIVEIPATAFVGAVPKWEVVASDGVYAWHDHRAHWMNPQSPPGAEPGDQILEGVIPLVVDASEVDVTVISVWEQPASRIPLVVGALVGGAGLAFAWNRPSIGLIGASLVALVLGSVAFLSVPLETAPPWLLWVLPLSSLGVLALGRNWLLPASVQLLAAAIMLGWVGFRREWLTAAILPTVTPVALDQALTASVSVLTVALGARALYATTRPGPA